MGLIILNQRTEIRVPVLYLDIDGTVRESKEDALGKFVNTKEDVRVFPEAIKMMQSWKDMGGLIAGVTNQGGIALGIVSKDDVIDALRETQRQTGNLFDVIQICQHHPDATSPEMAYCWCRKPSAGAVAEAAHGLSDRFPNRIFPPHMSLFVGDRPEDELCARNSMMAFEWARDWRARA